MASEQWIVSNLTAKSFSVGIPGTPSLTRFSQFDLLQYTDKTTVCNNARLRTLIENLQIIVKKYDVNGSLTLTVNATNVNTALCEQPAVVLAPTAQTPATFADVDTKVDKVTGAVEGDLASLTSTGDLADSGKKVSDFAPTVHHHAIADVNGLQTAIDAKANEADLDAHKSDQNNPHHVTASQVDAYTIEQADALLAGKANTEHCHEISDVDGLQDALDTLKKGGAGSGSSGFSGYSGRDGVIGHDGAAGASGVSGYSGIGLSGFSGYSGAASSVLGAAEDGSYTDGLWTDLTTTTPIGTFADRVNEILLSLVPTPAPDLTSIDATISGVSGKVSFDASNPIGGYSSVDGIGALSAVTVDNAFSLSGKRKGIVGTSITGYSGQVADNVASSTSYVAHAFGSANTGFLHLEVNGTVVDTIDLTITSAFSTSHWNLSAATPVVFPSGATFTGYQYRTGYWKALSSEFRNGWNYIRVRHEYSTGLYHDSSYVDFLWDADSADVTSFGTVSLASPAFSGSKYLSGVQFYTLATSTLQTVVSNAYHETYVDPNALTYTLTPSSKMVTLAARSLPANGGNESATYSVSESVSSNSSGIRFLDEGYSGFVTVKRTVQSQLSSSAATVTHILLDNVAASSTTTNEGFDDENYRLPSNGNFDSSSTAVTSSWTSTNVITTGTGYSDGLQVYGSNLVYPTVNFSTIANGPGSNPNYSSASGARTYYRFFDLSPTAYSNYVITISGTGTPRANSYSMTNSTNDFKVDIKLPNGSSEGTGWLDCTQFFATANWADGNGCLRSGTFSLNSAIGITVGTKSTGSTSISGKVFLRIRVPQGWTGSFSGITFVGSST